VQGKMNSCKTADGPLKLDLYFPLWPSLTC